MFVKICGITNLRDAQAAAGAGARALGFNFHPLSPRFVEPDGVGEWIGQIPASVWRVGIFVDRSADEVERVCRALRLDVAQLHGTESPGDAPRGVRVWKAFRFPAAGAEFPDVSYPAEALLLDGAASGCTFDWKIARRVQLPVILAGGLNEWNVAEAIREAQPWGVDACSSLEIAPGKKDHARMARFLKACQPLVQTSL